MASSITYGCDTESDPCWGWDWVWGRDYQWTISPWKKAGLDVMQSHQLYKMHFSQASSALLGWPGDRNCYLMHRMQPSGLPYLKGRSKAPLFIQLSFIQLFFVRRSYVVRMFIPSLQCFKGSNISRTPTYSHVLTKYTYMYTTKALLSS